VTREDRSDRLRRGQGLFRRRDRCARCGASPTASAEARYCTPCCRAMADAQELRVDWRRGVAPA